MALATTLIKRGEEVLLNSRPAAAELAFALAVTLVRVGDAFHVPTPLQIFPLHSAVTLVSFALVSGSLPPLKPEWHAITTRLFRQETLIVLPHQVKLQRIARSVALQLKAKGRRVRVMNTNLQQIAI